MISSTIRQQTHNPHARDWMLFVDGENLTIQGQKLIDSSLLIEGDFYSEDTYIWFPCTDDGRKSTIARRKIFEVPLSLQESATRAHYYAMTDPGNKDNLEEKLRSIGFEPNVFTKTQKQKKTKGLDIKMTVDILGYVSRGVCSTIVLMAGDGDYVPLVQEVKRYGCLVILLYFDEASGLNRTLKIAADDYMDITEKLKKSWQIAKSLGLVK